MSSYSFQSDWTLVLKMFTAADLKFQIAKLISFEIIILILYNIGRMI